MAKRTLLKRISTFLDSDLARIGVALAAFLGFLISLLNGYNQLADRFKEPTATPRIIRSHIHTSTVESPKYDLPLIKCNGDCGNLQRYRAIPVRVRLINPRAEPVSFMNFELFLSKDPVPDTEEKGWTCGINTHNRICFSSYKVDDERLNPKGDFNTSVTLPGHQVSDVDVLFAAWLMILEKKDHSSNSDTNLSEALETMRRFLDINRIASFPYYNLKWEDQNGVKFHSSFRNDEWYFNLQKFSNIDRREGHEK